MLTTFQTLVTRDHDEIAAALDIIMEPRTTSEVLRDVIDATRLAFTVHAVAEQRVLTALLKNRPSFTITEIVRQSRLDHLEQQQNLAALAALVPGCRSWNKLVLDLRSGMLRHALDAPAAIAALEEAIDPVTPPQLASRYATERMRVLAETLPVMADTAS